MAVDYKAAARQRAKQRTASSWYRLKETTADGQDNMFRILPTPEGETSQPVWTEYALHREVGPKKATVRCGREPLNGGKGKCYICDVLIPKLEAKRFDARAEALRSRDVFLVQVASVTMVDEDPTFAGPLLFTPAKGVADQILSSVIGSKKRSFEDPKKGFNLSLSRTGTGRNDTRYGMIEPDVDPSVVPAEIVKKLKPFDQLKEIPKYSEAAQKAAYTGQDLVEEPEEDDDEPAPRKKTKVPAPDEDDEDVIGDDDADEEEEPAPPAKKKKPAVVEDDDEDEVPAPKAKKKPAVVEDDEDDEPVPAPKKKKVDTPVDEDIDDDEPAPPAKSKKKPAVDDDDEDEAPAPAKRKVPPPAPKRKK